MKVISTSRKADKAFNGVFCPTVLVSLLLTAPTNSHAECERAMASLRTTFSAECSPVDGIEGTRAFFFNVMSENRHVHNSACSLHKVGKKRSRNCAERISGREIFPLKGKNYLRP